MSAPLFDTPVIGCNLDSEEGLSKYDGNGVIRSSLFRHNSSMIAVHVLELRTEFTETEIWHGSFSNFGRGTAGMDGLAGFTTFGNAEDRGVMCGPQTGTMWRSEERAVFPAMAGKERISITTICTSCSKKF